MKIAFYGDIHGQVSLLRQQIEYLDDQVDHHIQVGDFGIGFVNDAYANTVNAYENFEFIRGNHDNPELSRQHPKNMGDFGTRILPDGTKMMWIAGAWSIDWEWRTPGVSWWHDEQLSQSAFETAFEIYKDFQPDLMITHDGPAYVTNEMFLKPGLGLGGVPNSKQMFNITNVFLEDMFQLHQPKAWIYGHWHHHVSATIKNVKFTCVAQNRPFILDTQTFEGEAL